MFPDRKSKSLTLIAIFATFALPTIGFAVDKTEPKGGAEVSQQSGPTEFFCEADVNFTWKRVPSPTTSASDSAQPSATVDPQAFAEQTEFFRKIIESGNDRAAVEQSLKSKTAAAESAAKKVCEERHASVGSCLATKFATYSSNLPQLDFETRRTIREQFTGDCERSLGVCLSAKMGEVSCTEIKPPAPATAEGAGGEKEKKK